MKAKLATYRRHCEIMDCFSAFIIAFFGTMGQEAQKTIDKHIPKI